MFFLPSVNPSSIVKSVRRAAPAAASSAALDAIRKWTFRPFSAAGQPVAVHGRLEVPLDLQ